MLRQELQQSEEALAARSAEVEELKARVADLEKLQAQQQQLISLKDSELAAAQQRMATSNQQPAATLAQPAAPVQSQAQGEESGGLVWLWIGVALIAAGLLAWWLSRRRGKPAPPARVFDTASLAAGLPKAADAIPAREAAPASSSAKAMPDPTPVVAPAAGSAGPAAPAAAPPVPSWNAPGLQSVDIAPTWHAGGKAAHPPAGVDDAAAATVAPLHDPAGHERIELARAYLDLGDTDTARTLLREVADGADDASRSEASRMLRGLA